MEETADDLSSSISYQSPYINPEKYYLAEHFDNRETYEKNWIKSEVSCHFFLFAFR